MKLHKHQEALLDLLRRKKGDLAGMSLRAIGAEVALPDKPQVIAHHLERLEDKGYIRKQRRDGRVYEVLKTPVGGIALVDLYSTTAQCGPEGFLGEDCVLERVPVASKAFGITNPSDYFLVKARGDSMEEMIHDGDLVLARRQDEVDSGQIAVLVHDGMPKIKRVVKTADAYVLHSLNDKIEREVVIPKGDVDLRICGLVRGVLKFS